MSPLTKREHPGPGPPTVDGVAGVGLHLEEAAEGRELNISLQHINENRC